MRDNFAEVCLPNKQNIILLSTSELALKFGRVIAQHKKAFNQNHLANDGSHGTRIQDVAPLSIQDRTVVRLEVVSELRCRSIDHDIECRALAMLRDHSVLNLTQQKRNKSKPCRRDGHDTRTGKSPERSSSLTSDQISSDNGPDSLHCNTSAKDMDARQAVSPGHASILDRRTARLRAQE